MNTSLPRGISNAPIVRIQSTLAFFASLCIGLASQAGQGSVAIRTVALSGQQAPGLPEGVTFLNAEFETALPGTPSIDNDGNVISHIFLAGPGISIALGTGNMRSIWKESAVDGGQVLELVARQGSPAPGTSNAFEAFPSPFSSPTLSMVDGQVAFRVLLRGIQSFGGFGVWSNTSGSVELHMLAGQQAPGLPQGVTFGSTGFAPNPFFSPLLNANGHLLQGILLGGAGVTTDNNESIWSNRSGAVQLVVREGQAAPGTGGAVFGASNSIFATTGLRAFNFSAQSLLGLHGNLSGAGIDDFNDEGIWTETSTGNLTLLVRESDPAPGIPGGGTFGRPNGIDAFSGPIFNDLGTVLFFSPLSNLAPETLPPFTSAGLESAWSTRGGMLATIVRYGDHAPDEPEGVRFAGINEGSISHNDAFAFVGILGPPGGGIDFQDFGIWWEFTPSDAQVGKLNRLVRDGTPVPGFKNLVFGSSFPSNTLTFDLRSRPSSNGRLVFTALTSIPGNGLFHNEGLFVADASTGIETIAMTGEPFDVNGDGTDMRIVVDFLPGNLNDAGHIVFKLLFTDGTIGIFTTDPGQTPQPGDVDGDGVVNIDDLLAVISAWGACPSAVTCPADLNDDAQVNVDDLLIVIANFG